jgi:cystathionine beta-lyase
MKKYDFDLQIERRGTDCVKYDAMESASGRTDLLPLWVADMDFRTPDFIVDALKKRCEHEIFGYTIASDAYYNAIINWVSHKHGWKIQKDWISYIPGIVKGIGFAVQCFTNPGDKVIIQPPVYHPFRLVPQRMGREVVFNPLKVVDGRYAMDFEHLETLFDERTKLFILCSPHNPGGIVWEKEVLQKLAEVCAKHHVLIVSDEIHSEMAFPNYTHHPFATVSPTAAANSLVFMAPSKTFNIAGIVSSYVIIPDDKIRQQFFDWLEASEMSMGTIFAYTATKAAYENGADWLKQMIAYVVENVKYTDRFMQEHLPQIKVYPPEASFLVWLDCRGLGLDQKSLVSLFENEAGLLLNDGTMFGPGGEGFMRLNVGCPRTTLEKAFVQLEKAIRSHFAK